MLGWVNVIAVPLVPVPLGVSTASDIQKMRYYQHPEVRRCFVFCCICEVVEVKSEADGCPCGRVQPEHLAIAVWKTAVLAICTAVASWSQEKVMRGCPHP